jgi:hypothetical protein
MLFLTSEEAMKTIKECIAAAIATGIVVSGVSIIAWFLLIGVWAIVYVIGGNPMPIEQFIHYANLFAEILFVILFMVLWIALMVSE